MLILSGKTKLWLTDPDFFATLKSINEKGMSLCIHHVLNSTVYTALCSSFSWGVFVVFINGFGYIFYPYMKPLVNLSSAVIFIVGVI